MSIKIHIPDNMRYITEGTDVVEVNGGTVGECLRHLVRKFPGMQEQLFDENMVPKYLDILVNKKSSYPEELTKPVLDGDEFSILYIGWDWA